MRRRFVSLAVGVLGIALWSAPAGALALREHPVSGSVTGTFSVQASVPGCGGGPQVSVTAQGDIAPFGASSFVAADCGPDPDTFVLTAPDGIVTGVVTNFDFFIFREFVHVPFNVAITGGTGPYVNASGSLSGDLLQSAGPPLQGPITGTIAYGPPLPTAKGDCHDSGWRGVADDHGVPFKNQGQCIAFVVQQPTQR